MDALLHYRGHEKKKVRPDGYMRVRDVLQYLKWYNVDYSEFQKWVHEKHPRRFEFTVEPDIFRTLDKDSAVLFMRRTAHIKRKVMDVAKHRILDPKELRQAIYKAPRREWARMKASGITPRTPGGVIKLSPLEYVEENTDPVETSFVYINLDVEKAMREGVDFYRTRMRNIVTPGSVKGRIKPSLFKDVTFVDVNQEILK